MSEASTIFGVAPTTPAVKAPAGITVIPDNDGLTINASDAADVHIAEDDDF